MNTQILNRTGTLPTDGWYQIEVAGEHFNRAAGVVQVLDSTAFDSIVNRFKAAADKAGADFSGLLVDQDHFSLDVEKSTEAFGWLMEVRNRAGQLEGRVDWTDIGEPAVTKKRFKFFSSVYNPEDVEKVGTRKVKNKTVPAVRPLALDRLALTNDPNNKGGKPISNREERDESQPNTMKTLLKKLGLAEDASEESGLAALQVIVNRATTAEANLATVTADRDGLLDTAIDADLEKYKGVIKNRESVKLKLKADRKGTLEFLEGLQPGTAPKKPITNRGGSETPETPAVEGESDGKAEAALAKRIKNRADELKATNPRRAFSACFQQARGEIEKAD
ncbi:MAG: phage protease [Opitutaceae bacterium]|jgi:phage I-like protein